MKIIEAGLQQVPSLLDLAEAQIESIGMEDLEQVAKSMINLTRKTVNNLELSRDDKTIQVKLKKLRWSYRSADISWQIAGRPISNH